MTVLTRMSLEKAPAPDALRRPLVDDDANEARVDIREESPKVATRSFIIIRKRPVGNTKRHIPGALFCIFVMALLVTSFGILGGILLYKQYARATLHRYQGWCAIPYDNLDQQLIEPRFQVMSISAQGMFPVNSRDVEMLEHFPTSDDEMSNFLKETFDIGDNYEKIIVSDYRDGRHSNIVHDFYANMSGIVDADRCFVMPMNHNLVMQPDIFITSIQGSSGFDLSTVRNTMRAVLPALVDLTNTGLYIGKECSERPTYLLEKQNGTIRKRSADIPSAAKFAHFSGKHIQEIDIVNIDELLAYEEKKTNAV